MIKKDSITKRFAITLIVNIIKLFTGVIASTIVPRSLGPTNYGNYQFIFRTGTAFRTLFGLGTNQAFFTYSSKNTKSGLMLKIYFSYLVFELALITALILLADHLNFLTSLYPDQILLYVLLITFVEWLNFTALSFIQLGESKAESVIVQKANLWTQILKITLILVLYAFDELTLITFISINILTFLFTISLIIQRLIINKWNEYFSIEIHEYIQDIKQYFYKYCSPLISFTVVTFIYTFFERWFLQVISGSVQQAYFSIAFQWNSISLLFTTSILNIFWNEISNSFGDKDIKRIKRLFPKVINLTYFIASVISIFIVFNAKFLLSFFAGEEYIDALNTLLVFSFYPIFQSIGQLTSSYFLATEQTKKYRNLGLISLLLGIIGTYLVLAPKSFIIPGLELDSTGLAAKIVILQIIMTNIYLFIISKQLSIKYISFIKIQLLSISSSLVIAMICFLGLSQLFSTNSLLGFIITSFIYLVSIAILIYFKPGLIGIENNLIKDSLNKLYISFTKK